VFVQVIDPVGGRFVPNLARPGGYLTGFTSFEFTIGSKWLEALKHVAPKVTRVASLDDQSAQGAARCRDDLIDRGVFCRASLFLADRPEVRLSPKRPASSFLIAQWLLSTVASLAMRGPWPSQEPCVAHPMKAVGTCSGRSRQSNNCRTLDS
jgi:hypothetical protein